MHACKALSPKTRRRGTLRMGVSSIRAMQCVGPEDPQDIAQESTTARLALGVASRSGISKLVLRVNDRAGIQVAGTETTPDVEMSRQCQLQ